jgi:formylglycine-generating enzyme required for sulfatase activity
MNALRGEVEVARGLMGASEQVEDPAQLRKELNESKKNIEIALRLRAEAEAVRDRALQERDALQQQLESDGLPREPLHVPSLDEGEASARHPGPEQRAILPVIPLVREQDSGSQSLVDSKSDNRQRRWLGATIGLGAVVMCALAGWFFIGVDMTEVENNPAQQLPVVTVPDAESMQAVPGDSPMVNAPPAMPHVEVEVEAASANVEVSASVPDPVAGNSSELDEQHVQAPVEEEVRNTQRVPVIAGRSFRENLQSGGQGPVMVELPAGSYEMGSIGNSLNFNEGPRHQVKLAAFSISKFEVTFEEYDRFARATGHRLPYDESWGRADRPVINVSWDDARAYIRWLSEQTGKNYRLPSEAEWEYATRAGSVDNFWWRDSADNLHANCFNCGSQWDGTRTAPVGSFEANDFGLHDVTGNVQEWTADCYHGSYNGAPGDGNAWQFPECAMRVVRGGAYTSPLDSLRSAKRSQYDQDTRLDNLGFRVVREN